MSGRRSTAPLLLTELIAAVVIFIACTVVCIGLFVSADKTSERSHELTCAVFAAENAAECFDSNYRRNFASLLGADELDGGYAVGYDSDWNKTDENAAYTLKIAVNGDEQLLYADISVTSADGREIYSLQATARENGGER